MGEQGAVVADILRVRSFLSDGSHALQRHYRLTVELKSGHGVRVQARMIVWGLQMVCAMLMLSECGRRYPSLMFRV
jgi:hypothetical protein